MQFQTIGDIKILFLNSMQLAYCNFEGTSLRLKFITTSNVQKRYENFELISKLVFMFINIIIMFMFKE